MTPAPEDFEDRLRRVLNHAAHRLDVPAVAWEGPSPDRPRTPKQGGVLTLAGVAVAVAIAVSLVALLHHRTALTGGPGGSPPPTYPPTAFEPHLSGQEKKSIGAAWKTVVARDRACSGTHGSEVTHGWPPQALTAQFAILRRPPERAPGLQASLRHMRASGAPTLNQEVYLNQIHPARTAFGARFYVIPAGNVTGQQGVPARCTQEQVVTLMHRVAHLDAGPRHLILTAQRRWLAYMRYLATHPGGICASFTPPGSSGLGPGDNFGCASLAEFARWGVLADGSAYLGGSVGVFWTVVPDWVSRVTVRFPGYAAITAHPVNNVLVVRQPWKAPDQSGFPSAITLHTANRSVSRTVNVTPDMITLCGYGC